MSQPAIKKEAYRLITRQLILIAGLAAIFLLVRGVKSGLSVFVGGLAYWLPTFIFVWRVFARATARAAKQFMLIFAAGESVKLFLSAILFVLVINYLPVELGSVLIGFIGAVVAFWIASVMLLAKHQETSE